VRRGRSEPGIFRPADERFRAELRRVVDARLRPHAARWERTGRLPRAALASLARRGFFSLDPRRQAVLAEELPRSESPGLALSAFVQSTLVAPLFDRLGTAEQKRRFLAPVLRGRAISALAVTEPAAGSDFGALACRADDRAGAFVLNGVKTYITNGTAADFWIVAARTSSGAGERTSGTSGMSLIVVPRLARGVHVERLETLGLRTTAMGRIAFKNCRVPAGHLLGERGAAFAYVQDALNRERLFGGLSAVAWAEHTVQKTAAFARARRAFGQRLTRFQAIRHQFAEMATALEAARQLNYATFRRWLDGQDVTKEVCMIKLFSYDVVQRAIERCLQIHGGRGYLADEWISRFYRDARALSIAAGTPEVMKDVIAAYLRL
jgi:alkylation response protein AidB-like acyl-CoA dehydrogenase